ncbi:MAG: stage III sporulation protein AF [Epulopiscium sp.]|nr:stage III sporulation protein AF [Candidatus Epulonipiscium sp.]
MITLFGSWMKNIALFVILSSFVEMLMPEKNYKKYIHMMQGLILILIIIKPITGLFFSNQKLEDLIELNQLEMERRDILTQGSMIATQQDALIIETYKGKISEQIAKLIENNSDYKAKNIEVFVSEDRDDEDYGNIKEIRLTIDNKNTNSKNKRIKPINPVKINTKKENKENTKSSLEDTQLEKNIKNLIINFYNLSSDNIHITVQKKS